MNSRRPETTGREDGGARTTLLLTTVMLILVSFFVVLVSRSNFDETRYAAAVASIEHNFGSALGGRLAVGEATGLPDESLGPDSGGLLLVQEPELARIRALLAPAALEREARIIHTRSQKIVSLSAGLLFRPDTAEITASMAETLKAFGQIMASNNVPITVEGHTDRWPPTTEGVGDNWDLSAARALAVLDFLAGPGGLRPERLTAMAYAGQKPMHSNMTPAGRAGNNRVDLVLDFTGLKGRGLDDLADREASYNFQGFDFLIRGDENSGGGR
ncbi:MAG: OmpA family protein [Candidatus Adiutrix sp.]|jgi:chemotaxis protein MotB|nr:OmpA family protein [Candidatus Adiutrix sp.]